VTVAAVGFCRGYDAVLNDAERQFLRYNSRELRRFLPLPLGGRHIDDGVRRLVDSLGLRRRRRRGKRAGRRVQPRPVPPAGSVPVVLEACASDDVTAASEYDDQLITAGLRDSELSSTSTSSAFTQSSSTADCQLLLEVDDEREQVFLSSQSHSIPVIVSDRHGVPCRRRRLSLPSESVNIDCVAKLPHVDSVHTVNHTRPAFYVINPTSLAKPHALQKFTSDLVNFNIDVSVVVETWFKVHHSFDFTNIPGYNLFRRDRTRRRGGGVGIYVRSDLKSKLCEHQVADIRIELLWIEIIFNNHMYIVGALYHPPKALYKQAELLSEIESSIDIFTANFSEATVVLAGDFNQLPDICIQELALQPFQTAPTHGNNCLDRIYCSEPLDYCCQTVVSAVETGHKAIVARFDASNPLHTNKIKSKIQFRTHTPNQNAAFLDFLKDFSWDEILDTNDAQTAFDKFYEIANNMLDLFFPERTVTLSNKDPYYITPEIKLLLRKKNKLLRKGRIDEVDALTKRISQSISAQCRCTLANVTKGGKAMWDKVNTVLKKKPVCTQSSVSFTAEQLNNHFASVSTDSCYKPPLKKTSANPQYNNEFSESEIFHLLDRIKPTASGLDSLPYWFLKLAAPSFAQPVAHLFGLSLQQSVVPSQWKISCITPVPKTSQPQSCQQYRPISVTPILSRLMEKIVVRKFLYPVLCDKSLSPSFSDQFAFRPTGSTTSALIFLLHQLTDLLQTHDYVHLIALDFSKAFDTVRHSSLLHKMACLPLPDNIYNWILDFLTHRLHETKFNGLHSSRLNINSSIIQGSGLGPVLFVINAHDLHPIYPSNLMFKYADDTYLIIPSNNSHLISEELAHVSHWAGEHNLRLNVEKSVEVIVHRPQKRDFKCPQPTFNISRKSQITVLGVVIGSNLKFDKHVENILQKTSKTMFALRVLRAHGMPDMNLWDITKAVLVPQVMYALSAWWGFVSVAQKNRLESIVRKAKKYGFLPPNYNNLEDLSLITDEKLFFSVKYRPHHVLKQLLPPTKNSNYSLRDRSHNLTLPSDISVTKKRNFIYRMLFTDIY